MFKHEDLERFLATHAEEIARASLYIVVDDIEGADKNTLSAAFPESIDLRVHDEFFGPGLQHVFELQQQVNSLIFAGIPPSGLAAPSQRLRCPDCRVSEGHLHRPGCKENFRECIRQLGIRAAIERLSEHGSVFYYQDYPDLLSVFSELEFEPLFVFLEPIYVAAINEMRALLAPKAPPGWACSAYHFNPDTNADFLNSADRDKCEICGRPKPKE